MLKSHLTNKEKNHPLTNIKWILSVIPCIAASSFAESKRELKAIVTIFQTKEIMIPSSINHFQDLFSPLLFKFRINSHLPICKHSPKKLD
ncbi:hypothetical protein DERP_009595 [Dermatophagoides pteronyssinus]|uniref:Uncharacterized protein n=1 Tax=Dermatophagoides pteronyssinus TaxID=6956 RepID=A0ABQ8JAW4_DERPT|nr:hypothetical protein DERP_009595 [Dermatophagoides pteronyssinus]